MILGFESFLCAKIHTIILIHTLSWVDQLEITESGATTSVQHDEFDGCENSTARLTYQGRSREPR